LKPIAFKVRGGGNYSGTKGGAVRPNEKGGAGYLGYEDKTFTIATSPDQWICTPLINSSPQPNPMNEPAQPAPVGRPIRYLSVCSGMEAASVAWHPLGWTPVGFSEIEPFPCAILKHRFPNVPNYGSLTEYQSWPLEPGAIDLLVGGTPCQSFSVAGLRKGLTDPRGNLALTFLGLADKLKPRWIVWENVPGVLSSNGGRDFGSFLGALVELGYGFAYRVLDAQHFGVPQRRRRVFVVACLGDWRAAAEVLSLREGLRGYLETGNKKRKGVAADAGASVEAGGLPIWRAGDQANAEHMIDHAGTVSCNKGSHGGFIAKPVSHWEGSEVHPTLNQSASGCGSPGYSNQELFSQKGAGLVSTPYRKSKRACSTTDNETWVLADSSNTLNNFDLGDTRTTHAVVQPMAFSAKDNGPDATIGISPTLRSQNSVEGNQNSSWSIAIVQPAIPIHDQATHHAGKRGDNQDGKGNGLGIGKPGDPMNTLTQGDKHAVAYHTMPGSVAPTIGASGPPYSRTGNERVEAEALAITFQPGNLRRDAGADPSTTTTTTLKASAGDQTPHVCYPLKDPNDIACEDDRRQNGIGNNGDPAFTLRTAVKPGVMTAMAVRRLTPNECYRLQGFPDNWGRIPWKGKPAEECPDGPQYKACGNSMAVPVMRWIGERIAAVDATL